MMDQYVTFDDLLKIYFQTFFRKIQFFAVVYRKNGVKYAICPKNLLQS